MLLRVRQSRIEELETLSVRGDENSKMVQQAHQEQVKQLQDVIAEHEKKLQANAVLMKKHEEIESDLRGVAQLWRDNADLERLMASRIISVEQHAGLVERLFQGRVNDWLYRFLQVVVRHRRGEKLLMISEAFDDLMDAKMGRIDVDAYVAQPPMKMDLATCSLRLTPPSTRASWNLSYASPCFS